MPATAVMRPPPTAGPRLRKRRFSSGSFGLSLSDLIASAGLSAGLSVLAVSAFAAGLPVVLAAAFFWASRELVETGKMTTKMDANFSGVFIWHASFRVGR